jgi:hypothetical protein
VDEILACKCRPWLRLGRDLLGVKMAHDPVGGITFRGLIHCWWIKGQHVASFLDKCRLRSFCCAIRGKYLFEFEWTKSAKNITKSGAVGYTAGCPKQRLDVDWFNIGEPCNVCLSPPLCESRSGTNFLGFACRVKAGVVSSCNSQIQLTTPHQMSGITVRFAFLTSLTKFIQPNRTP